MDNSSWIDRTFSEQLQAVDEAKSEPTEESGSRLGG
jgi:hypothetical protein